MTPPPDNTNAAALVTGGAGFIGTHLITELVANGTRVVSLDIAKPDHPVAGVEYIVGDVRQPLGDLGKFTTIYNLAAVHRTPGHPDNEYFETNVAGATNVTNFAATNEIQTIIFTSSISTYGPGEDKKVETTALKPVSAYGKSKAQAEDIHREWLEQDAARKLIIARPAVTFGRGENGNFDRLLKAMRQHRFVYPGRTDTIKSCGHVTDLVGSMAWAQSLGERSITYNFSYAERTTIEQIATTIADVFGISKPPFNVPFKLMLAASVPFELLGRVGLETGINRARMMKLVESTNVYPEVLVDRGYEFRTNLRTGIETWAKSLDV